MSKLKKDLTRIEDLSDFLHQNDPETDQALKEEDQSNSSLDLDKASLEGPPSLENIEEPGFIGELETEEENLFENEENQNDEEDDQDEESEDIFGEIDHQDEDLSENLIEGLSQGENENAYQESHQTEDDHELPELGEIKKVEAIEEIQEIQKAEVPPLQNQTIGQIIIDGPFRPLETDQDQEKPIEKTEPEKFKDLKEFAKNISYGKIAASGNPPFSLIVKKITFNEDAENILIILREHKLVDDSNEETMRQALQNGSILISQISEYSAIFLAHKLRRFDVDISLGLSEELYPSKSYKGQDGIGLINKKNFNLNAKDHYEYKDGDISINKILLSTTPVLQNHIINKYLAIISEHRVIEESELLNKGPSSTPPSPPREGDISFGLDEIYKEMGNDLKVKCLKLKGNAVVGINFQLTPLLGHQESKAKLNYKITVTGNAVWVLPHGDPIEHS